MNNNNIKFNKDINAIHNLQKLPKTQRQNLVIKLMKEYNLSEEEAENILKKIEQTNSNEKLNKNIPKNDKIKQNHNNKLMKDNKLEDSLNPLNQTNKNTYDDENITDATKKHDIDKIISNIIPDYNKHLSIELKNVNLTFEVDNEKVDTIKESVIRLLKKNRSKKFKIKALKDVTFKIYKGEKVGIIGYNGAGKSTLLNVITGIFPPDTGCVKTYGHISPLLTLGSGFDYNYSGRRNIILNGAILGYDKKFIESKVDEIIEFSELGEYIDIPIKNYSSGMLAKLGFSIATIVNPDILIIDEILSVGDVTFQKKSAHKIRSLMDGGTTVLLVSHSIPQIRELCDKAIWIDNGRVRQIGEVNEICNNYLKDSEKASNEQLANIQLK